MTDPTDEEIMELMPQQMRDDLATAARAAMIGFDSPKVVGACRAILNCHAVDHVRAALARWGNSQGILDSSLQPVAVSERLPGPNDCDEQGRCWWHGEGADMIGWTFDAEGASYYRAKFWLPANALPIPEATNG